MLAVLSFWSPPRGGSSQDSTDNSSNSKKPTFNSRRSNREFQPPIYFRTRFLLQSRNQSTSSTFGLSTTQRIHRFYRAVVYNTSHSHKQLTNTTIFDTEDTKDPKPSTRRNIEFLTFRLSCPR